MGRNNADFNDGKGISNFAKKMKFFNREKYESSENGAEDLNARAEMDEGK
jgi:hypothetical protein